MICINGRGNVTWYRLNFKAPNHISGNNGARIVKFLTQVGYVKCYQRYDISPPKWAWLWSSDRFKCCRLLWCSASRGFVSDSWSLIQFRAVETVGRYNGGVVLHQDPVANLDNVWVLFHVVESRHVHTGTQRNATRRATPRGTASGVNAT